MSRLLEPARAAFASVGRRGAGPLVVALALALLVAGQSPTDLGAPAAGVVLLWLHLPGVVLAATAVVATIDVWPLFGNDRDGRASLRRIQHSPLDGCGMATLGGAAAAALLLAAAGLAFGAWSPTSGALEPPRAFSRLALPARATLDAGTDRVVLDGRGIAADAIRLNPLVVATRGGGYFPVELQVAIDGLTVARNCRVSGNGEQILLLLPAPRAVHEVVVTRATAATLTLLFPPGSVELRSPRPRSLGLNLALASGCYALPALLAMLAAAALRRSLGMPALATFALAAFAILALAGTTPAAAALDACARGRWLLGEPMPWRTTGLVAVVLTLLGIRRHAAGSRTRGRAP